MFNLIPYYYGAFVVSNVMFGFPGSSVVKNLPDKQETQV